MPSITLQPLQPHRQQQQCLPSTPTTSPTRAQWTAPPLSPTVVVPRRLCRANADIEFLQRVDCVRITDITERDGVVYYCLDVYLYEEVNRIPTNKHRSSDAGLHLNWDARQPTYRVERRFSEFEVLRKAMSHYVNLSHSLPCDYCDEFASFFFLSVNQPRMFVKWTTGASKRKGILARFLNHSIVLGRERRSHCPYLCESHERIPMMLRRFLKTSCIQFTETLV
ncbi:TPA: hypothetical protein N0F65_002723 [Lagenidium giganteum]|uniref:PX domain-containing protein n=1 Tax=Lagenidium giganteum TaxID=4803 RepID=A0AAV2Z3X7_9STRA|nr:TPA: hypothetical protein N0F65_002723 [Lagenidium giganteum]